LFADIVGFTAIAARLPPARLVADLDRIVCAFDDLAAELGVEKIKTVGDAYLAVAGVPLPRPDHAGAAAELALRMTDSAQGLAAELGTAYQLRVGLHTGPVLAGVIGRRKFSYDVWGDTVNVASRLQQLAAPGQVTISAATRAALPGRFRAEALGSVELRGRGSFETHRLLRAAGC
jgi:class 3 adenylate cyclase